MGTLSLAGSEMRPTALVLLLLLGAAVAREPSWYSCDCSQRNNCMCPSLEAPGGLSPRETPQFILLTHDDAILPSTARAYRAVCDGRKNPNGCPFRATMFTQQINTDCDLAKGMWEDGYEIATHTANHRQMPAGYPYDGTVEEILGARRFLSQDCGIPEEQIRGFRSPYLVTNPVVRQVLFENGFLFDSTLLETGKSESLSKSFAKRTWPYTMDFGIAQNTDWFSDTQMSNASERWPGLWEVPMYVLEAWGLEWTMDVGYYGGRGVYEPLMETFEQAYNGNRAPLPIFLHTTWVDKDPDRVAQLERFADYTATKPDVFWVTMSQLIEWMSDPKPVSEMGKEMCARPKAPAPTPALPSSGANVTLSLLGATKTQVADQSDRLVAAVTKLLGPAASELFVAGVSGGAAASLSTAGASEEGGALKVQSIPSGQPPSGPALLNDGFMQFEGPTYEGSTLSIQSAEPSKPHKGSKGGGVGALSMEGTGAAPPLTVVLAAFGADPLAIYKHAGDPARQEVLASELAALGFTMSGEPAVLPFENGKEVSLSSPPLPSAPAPVQQPLVQQQSEAPAPAPVAAPADTSVPAADSWASTAATAGSGASEASGLSTGAVVGIAVGGAALLAAIVAGAVVYRRRRGAGAAAASVASSIGAEEAPKEAAVEEEGAVSIAVRAT